MSRPGPFMAYFQQQAIMFPTKGPKYDPRQAFIDDLIKHVLSLQASGDHILIGIDANAELKKENKGIDKLV